MDIAVSILESFEGFKAAPYNCPAGVCTIGIGSTRYENGQPIKRNDPPISKARALAMARNDLKSAESSVRKLVKVNLTECQFAALILFTQNLGAGALAGSTLLRKINVGDLNGAQLEFRNWNNIRVNGKLVPAKGLTIRRYAESLIFSGVDPLTAYQNASRMFN